MSAITDSDSDSNRSNLSVKYCNLDDNAIEAFNNDVEQIFQSLEEHRDVGVARKDWNDLLERHAWAKSSDGSES